VVELELAVTPDVKVHRASLVLEVTDSGRRAKTSLSVLARCTQAFVLVPETAYVGVIEAGSSQEVEFRASLRNENASILAIATLPQGATVASRPVQGEPADVHVLRVRFTATKPGPFRKGIGVTLTDTCSHDEASLSLGLVCIVREMGAK